MRPSRAAYVPPHQRTKRDEEQITRRGLDDVGSAGYWQVALLEGFVSLSP